MVSFQAQRTGVWTPAAIKAIEEEEATSKRNERNRRNMEPTIEERLRNLEEENRNLKDRIGEIDSENHANEMDEYGKRKQKNLNAEIASLVFLILSVGLLLAGIFTAAFAALPLFVFIPMIALGAIGTVALPVIYNKARSWELYL